MNWSNGKWQPRLLIETYTRVLGSFRILSFTPWSAKDLDRNVDSDIPGKFLGGETAAKLVVLSTFNLANPRDLQLLTDYTHQ